jgi:hypothetical protein
MSLQTSIDQVAALMHTLATQDVIPNTFGMISSVHRGLQQILADLSHASAETVSGETVGKLRQVLSRIENGRLLFAIPETWLIKNVMDATANVRRKVEQLFPEARAN